MIELTKLSGKKFMLNCDMLETVESTPDTVVTLNNGKLYIVAEKPEQILALTVEFRRTVFAGLLLQARQD